MAHPSDFQPSPRRQLALQGPRPTPLKLNKDSNKIKKPPVAPQPRSNFQAPQPQQQQRRQPVIIYSVSPKILHTKPSDFMTLVQRLTGPDYTADTSVADLTIPSPAAAGALSPAARIATFEKSSPSSHAPDHLEPKIEKEMDLDVGIMLDRPSSIPGILSPLPSSLPPISPSFLNFLHDLSPAFKSSTSNIGSNNDNNNKSLWEVGGSSILISPSNNLSLTPVIPSPGAWGDFFNQLPDL